MIYWPLDGAPSARGRVSLSTDTALQRCIERFLVSAERVPAQVGLALQAWAAHRSIDQEATLMQRQALCLEYGRERAAIAQIFLRRLKEAVQAQWARLRSGVSPRGELRGELQLLDDAAMGRDLVAGRVARGLAEQTAAARSETLRGLAALLGTEELIEERDPFRPRLVADALLDAVAGSPMPVSARADFETFVDASWFGDLAPLYSDLLDQMRAEGIAPEPASALKAGQPLRPRGTAPDDAARRREPAAAPGTTPQALSTHQRFDLLATAFDRLFAHAGIPVPCKREICRLQTAIMHVALRDPRFFAQTDHPARQLLVRATQFAAEQGLAQMGGPVLAMQLEPIVDRVIATYRSDGDTFAKALLELESVHTRHVSQLTVQVSDLAAALAQREHEEATARHAAQQILELLAAHDAPPFLARFALDHWRPMLVDRMLVYGEEGPATAQARDRFARLMESVEAGTPGERQARAAPLVAWVESVFAASKASEETRSQFMDDWRAAQAALEFAAAARTQHGDAMAATNVEGAGYTQTTVLSRESLGLAAPASPASPFMQIGAWLDADGPVPMRGRYRLAWVSPLRSRYVLLYGGSAEPCVHTYGELSDAMDSGRLRFTPVDNPFDPLERQSS